MLLEWIYQKLIYDYCDFVLLFYDNTNNQYKNNKYHKYFIMFKQDKFQGRIVLFDNKQLQIETLQVGNPNESSLKSILIINTWHKQQNFNSLHDKMQIENFNCFFHSIKRLILLVKYISKTWFDYFHSKKADEKLNQQKKIFFFKRIEYVLG
ncbi:hypothetical protein RFI_25014 [Reticulomyxa filosa]|uniref:Uncharacterized protein n=1 Tax=Reticulomyxa filosa TaxID=46433 RepID=X6MES7_RETFI|nr:hypothetical protein RFI_25014 [Reticulomyxa filosa]|eukprot:ETO12364.1 hypothetical protein RFI_25014 [Reticulomyxa filosa]